MKLSTSLSLKEIFPELTLPDITFSGISELEESGKDDIVFIFKCRQLVTFSDRSFKFCFIDSSVRVDGSDHPNVHFVPNARLLLSRLLKFVDNHFSMQFKPSNYLVSDKAHIDPSAIIEKDVYIAPFCFIGAGAFVKTGSVIQSGVHIGQNSVIGSECFIDANTTLHSSVTLGDRVQVGSNSTIGSPGFGFERDGLKWQHLAHISGVNVGNDSFIGSNVCIDAGILKPTILENDVVIDNLVQIAHHVRVGELTAIAGCAGIAGSAQIGKGCLIGGGACINGHIKIADGTVVTGMTMVTSDINTPGVYSSGIPANSNSQWKKNAASFSHLAELRKDISKIKKELLER